MGNEQLVTDFEEAVLMSPAPRIGSKMERFLHGGENRSPPGLRLTPACRLLTWHRCGHGNLRRQALASLGARRPIAMIACSI